MAEFTEFNAPIGVAGPINVRRASAEDFGGDGGGLIQGGKNIAQLGKVLKDHQIKRENADINQSNIDNQGYGAELFRNAKENTDASATDFTTNVLAEYDRNMEVQLANAPDDRVRAEMKANFTRTRNTLIEKSRIFESATRGRNEVNVFVANGDKAANVLYENPTEAQYQETLAARIAEINNMSVADHVKQEFLQEEIKNLRFKQISGLLDSAVTSDRVDEILAQRPEDELTQAAFTQLGKTGVSKQREFKVEERLAVVEHNQAVRAAQASIRVADAEFSHGRLPTPDAIAHTNSLVNQLGDPVTSEMWFNVQTVGKEANGWLKLPSEDLEIIVAQLEQDAETGGSTPLEGALLDSARKVLRQTLAGERAEQAEIDQSVSDLVGSMDKRLEDGVDMSGDPDYIAMVRLLPDASPHIRQAVTEALALNAMVDDLMDKSPAELTTLYNDAEARRHLSDIEIVRRDAAGKVLTAMNKAVTKNYMDWVQHIDPAVFPPLDENDPASMKARETLMADGAAKYHKEPRFHTTSELSAIGERIPEMTSDEQLAFINGYTANMSRHTALTALTELAAVNPLLAYVGAGIAHDPNYALVGTQVLYGQRLLDAEGPKRVLTASGDTRSVQEAEIATALAGAGLNENLPSTYRVAVQSAALALLAGGTVTDPIVALNKVLGGTDDGDYGGIQTHNDKSFVAPVGVSGKMMSDVFEVNAKSLIDLSVDGSLPRLPSGVLLSGETIHDDGTFEYVGPDLYVVRMESDGKLVQGAPGTPYTLHINSDRLQELGVTQ